MIATPAPAAIVDIAADTEAETETVPTVASEIGLDTGAADAAPAADGHDAAAPALGDASEDVDAPATATATATDGIDAQTVDFSAVVASTTAPAQTVAMVAPPARPLAVGTHAPQGPGLCGAFFALVLVLGLILGLAWLLKRLPGSGFRQADGLKVVASIALGGKERAAVVQVGGEQLLLGIAAGGVRTLHVLPEPLPEAPPVQLPSLKTLPDFKTLLAQRLRKDT